MSTSDFITELFCRVDDHMRDVPKHSQSKLYPSEIVTLALLFALKGAGNRAFYRWVKRDYVCLFPNLPERTRLFRLFATHKDWADHFLADPTLLGVADSFGIELLHPMREGRSPNQIGRKGTSNRRWIVGAKLCVVLNKLGLVVGWDCATANVWDSAFQPLIASFEEQMIVVTDRGFYLRAGNPSNMKVCKQGTWNERMLVEWVFSMLTRVCHAKRMWHRVWSNLQAHLAYLVALFNLLVSWHGLTPDPTGRVHLSIAQFAL